MISKDYLVQVELLLKILPIVNKFDCFALKGGTAINLFFRNMPRLSVDIDLVYLPIDNRASTFININKSLEEMSAEISKVNGLKASLQFNKQKIGKILVSDSSAQIIIEPNYIIRGAVYNCVEKTLCPAAIDRFGYEYDMRIVSSADLFAGKICAALDRKHPRDLFDIKLLLEENGVDEELINAAVVYLACSKRPIHELLTENYNFTEFDSAYNEKFTGMTEVEILPEDLKKVRLDLIKIILSSLNHAHKQFLLSVTEGNLNWKLINIPNVERFPGILWKIENIKKLIAKNPDKYKQTVNSIKEVLEIK
ncbi:MAG: nucleotidyl transferase AbiEii/AbiGii toxin family protein [Deltaproteobacteria bacterium]|nr:nucleotidyl transferase AbiEii/AbiGii toxin family protein [Deltaproteobacteria bacterium]MCL5673105.1 nucleotidyl transferase AbiEii/AbiGii toxin family protein [Deltaproteobacteria bacterium]